jgi:uncharacterized membrane protein
MRFRPRERILGWTNPIQSRTTEKGEVMLRKSTATKDVKAAILAGAATGLRSTVGIAALINDRAAGLPPWLAGPPAAVLAPVAAMGELANDKLPSTASRLEPMGLAARVLSAGLAGTIIARSTGQPALPATAVAAAAALASARVGHDLRVALSKRLPSGAVAAGEDGLAFALAEAAGNSLP